MKLYKNIKTNKIEKAPIALDKIIKDKDGNDINVVSFTTDEKIILASGYEIYTPPKAPVIDVHQRVKRMRFSKRKVKTKLVELKLWDFVKNSLSEDEYEDLMLSNDFAFDDDLFERVYNMLQVKIDNIDELLIQCKS